MKHNPELVRAAVEAHRAMNELEARVKSGALGINSALALAFTAGSVHKRRCDEIMAKARAEEIGIG